ncbi:hypothetical protein A3D66_02480 [Candidatus Kaiserbacteria bacterium RIFCSPHIGHO2_02_FULL_50_9]|nr:MAG: hypothetical protein A2761_03165 [Candidatus Kaiserbacteria bacterium RIFCSPHIGHO2_01_FULL_51_33]OGG63803.1 MAG: hypothetical protein A3D66_02480 [Candidatus Kaiserbacteria bacterium RIFCSPHIGHO2_02_FULL_50_9]
MLHWNAEGETTVRIVRKHWFILLQETAGFVVLFFAPFILYGLLTGSAPFGATLGLPTMQPVTFAPAEAALLTAAWTLFIWAKLFGAWTNYYLDVWIITNRRIVSIDQIRFFSRTMSIFRMDRIQDVTVDVHGFIPTLLNFGDLQVQTAGVEQKFIIRGVPRPQHIKDIIMREHDTAVERPVVADGVS